MSDVSTPKKPRKTQLLRGLVELLGIPGVFLMAPLIQAGITIVGGGAGFIVWYVLRELAGLEFLPSVLHDLMNFTYMPVIAVLIGVAVAYVYGTFLYLDLAGHAWYRFYIYEELERGYSWYWRYK